MGPIGKFADSDGAFARANSAARVGLVGIGAGTQFIGVADLIIVRISGGPILGIAQSSSCEVVDAVIERIKIIFHFPSVGQTVTVGVSLLRVSFRDQKFWPTIGLGGACARRGVGGEQCNVVDRPRCSTASAEGGASDG